MLGADAGTADALAGVTGAIFARIAWLPLRMLAAIAGPAIGGDAELAYACDFRIANTKARFGTWKHSWASWPPLAPCCRRPALVGSHG